MIEKEQDFFCQIHKAPVLMITCDQEKKKNQRFLCSQCMEHLDLKTQLMNFQKAHQYIQVNQELKKQSIENVLMININQLQYLQNTLYQLKSSVIQQLDQLIGNAEEWIKQIQSRGSAHLAYSFFDELEILITNSKFDQFDQKSIVDQINFINQSWIHKIMNKINLFKQFQETQKCSELLNNIMFKGNQQNDIMNQNEVEQEDKELQQNQLEFKSMIDQRIEIKLIDDSNKQIGYCFAIVFDKTDSIMVSCSNNEIKIWNFKLGRLSLINTYQEHSKAVTCLVYSKIKNTFISGSHDHTILCWQQINQKEWKCSQKYQQHNGTVHCLMLTQDEDQLLSGGCDHSIKVWKIDFIKNELNFQYSLNNHGNSVKSFSFNESETLLISCGLDHFIIWEKGQQGKWEFKYMIEQDDYLILFNLI